MVTTAGLGVLGLRGAQTVLFREHVPRVRRTRRHASAHSQVRTVRALSLGPHPASHHVTQDRPAALTPLFAGTRKSRESREAETDLFVTLRSFHHFRRFYLHRLRCSRCLGCDYETLPCSAASVAATFVQVSHTNRST